MRDGRMTNMMKKLLDMVENEIRNEVYQLDPDVMTDRVSVDQDWNGYIHAADVKKVLDRIRNRLDLN